jgi:hypothetical protein
MDKNELLTALAFWKDSISDSEWVDWEEYKSIGTYSSDLIMHNGDERITAIHFFCADKIRETYESFK